VNYNSLFFLVVVITQFFIGGYVMSDEYIEGYLDYEKLKNFRTDTTISGHYLKIWNVYLQHAKKTKSSIDIDNYLIHFSENKDEYTIFFKKPTTQKIVGGGHGACKINKKSLDVIECKFIK